MWLPALGTVPAGEYAHAIYSAGVDDQAWPRPLVSMCVGSHASWRLDSIEGTEGIEGTGSADTVPLSMQYQH